MKKIITRYLMSVQKDETRKSSLINLLLKPISVILGLIYTPLLLDYLGDTQYGLWSTVLSIISWVNYCDVGVGHGLRSVLTKAITVKDYGKTKRAVSTAYVILSAISAALLVVGMTLTLVLDWHKAFKTDINMRGPMGISIAFICLNFVLSLSSTVFYSLQQSQRVAIRNCTVQMLNIVGIVLLRRYTKSNLLLMAVLFGLTSSIVYISNTIQLIKKYSFIRILPRYFDRDGIHEIANVGVRFFVIQIACVALYTVDNLLITNLFGGAAVTPFNITYRLFNTVHACLIAACVPYWSKTTQAIEQRDFKWIRHTVKHLNYIAVLFMAGLIVLALIFKPLARIWLRRDLDYPAGLILVMCVYYCLYTIVTVKTQVINGTGCINFQMYFMIIIGALNIPLSIFLAKNCGMGVVGIRLATTILMLAAAIAFPINLKHIIQGLESTTEKEDIRSTEE